MTLGKGTWLADNKVPVLTVMAALIALLGIAVTIKNVKGK
jgi:hypothetical protein